MWPRSRQCLFHCIWVSSRARTRKREDASSSSPSSSFNVLPQPKVIKGYMLDHSRLCFLHNYFQCELRCICVLIFSLLMDIQSPHLSFLFDWVHRIFTKKKKTANWSEMQNQIKFSHMNNTRPPPPSTDIVIMNVNGRMMGEKFGNERETKLFVFCFLIFFFGWFWYL